MEQGRFLAIRRRRVVRLLGLPGGPGWERSIVGNLAFGPDTVEDMREGGILGTFLGSHFWAPKPTQFSSRCGVSGYVWLVMEFFLCLDAVWFKTR